MTLRRGHSTCRRRGANAHPLDDRLGVDGLVGPHARRLRCLAGVERAFERAARLLRELAGLHARDNTVRAACDRHGGRMRTWQRGDPEAARLFRAATGDVEFQTDGTCVNATGGGREVRLSIFAKRRRGEPVTDLDDWDEPRPPVPHVRVAAAAIRTGAAPGPQWRRAAARMGLKRADELTAPADGAKWIGNGIEKGPPGAAGVLDIDHAGEHRHAAAVARHGAGPAAVAWYERRRRTPLESGSSALLAEVASEPGEVSEWVGYSGPHAGHTPYRQRLAEGRSIGSGMVEGACKTAIGKRLQQPGARWKVRRLERMAALCCLAYGDQFDAYGKQAAGWRPGSVTAPILRLARVLQWG